MNRKTIVKWAKQYSKKNKLLTTAFKTRLKNNLPYSYRNIQKIFGSWSDFIFEVTGVRPVKKKPQSVKCKKCSKIFIKHYSQIKKSENHFCSRSCSATFFNRAKIGKNVHSEETKQKIRKSLIDWNNQFTKIIFIDKGICVICKKEFEYEVKNNKVKRCCSVECGSILGGRIGGRISAANNVRRSKNEIYFSELCIYNFGTESVLTNKPIFDGWDADVIIPALRIAILWNGVWHYKKITEKHSLKQVQNRDRIKNKIIKKMGYTPYIIKDMGSYNKNFVKEQFDIMLTEFNIPKKNDFKLS